MDYKGYEVGDDEETEGKKDGVDALLEGRRHLFEKVDGPWNSRTSYKPTGFEILGRYVGHGRVDDKMRLFTMVGIGATKERAQLVAAAPDLYLAAKSVIAKWDEGRYGVSGPDPIMGLLVHAVAKAEGKA